MILAVCTSKAAYRDAATRQLLQRGCKEGLAIRAGGERLPQVARSRRKEYSPMYSGRNEPLGFAGRTRKNLDFIINARAANKDVHEVTQIINSLLGLVVIPWEQLKTTMAPETRDKELAVLVDQGWPKWKVTFSKKSCDTLAELARHLRNAVSHGRVEYDSDSRVPADVTVALEDRDFRSPHSLNWKANIAADQLRIFCEQFTGLLELEERTRIAGSS
jgi:hypothetical protein